MTGGSQITEWVGLGKKRIEVTGKKSRGFQAELPEKWDKYRSCWRKTPKTCRKNLVRTTDPRIKKKEKKKRGGVL